MIHVKRLSNVFVIHVETSHVSFRPFHVKRSDLFCLTIVPARMKGIGEPEGNPCSSVLMSS